MVSIARGSKIVSRRRRAQAVEYQVEQAIVQKVAPVSTEVGGKQDTLVSGTNIKTVNGQSLLGSGDIVVSGGGNSYFPSGW